MLAAAGQVGAGLQGVGRISGCESYIMLQRAPREQKVGVPAPKAALAHLLRQVGGSGAGPQPAGRRPSDRSRGCQHAGRGVAKLAG